MFTRLQRVWMRHDDWAPEWAIIFYRILVVIMFILILLNLGVAVSAIIERDYIHAGVNILAAAWLAFLLFWYD